MDGERAKETEDGVITRNMAEYRIRWIDRKRRFLVFPVRCGRHDTGWPRAVGLTICTRRNISNLLPAAVREFFKPQFHFNFKLFCVMYFALNKLRKFSV